MAISRLLPNGIWVLPLLVACAHETSQAIVPDNESVRLTSLGGEIFDLKSTYEAHPAVVLVWWASSCPCVRRYQSRIEALYQEFAPRDVAFYAVASNADETPETVRTTVAAVNFTIPMLLDTGGRLARAMHARSTPTVVVLDTVGAIRFRGWIDNERTVDEEGRQPYLRNAIESILAGTADFAPKSPVYGCTITRSLFEIGHCQ